MLRPGASFFFFFFNDTATTEIYTLSLHDALPICCPRHWAVLAQPCVITECWRTRSEEHTSELQSRLHLVCRLLLEKKKSSHRSTVYRLLVFSTVSAYMSVETDEPSHDY